MNRPSKIIRIFVCSTFKEFEKERNELAKDVFPELREMCRKAGMVFRVVDLRWGISKQDSADHQTIPICLSEIRKCQEQSPDLNFLVMAGMDYGSVLAPSEISARDWNLLMNNGGLDSEAQSLLADCYQRDFNAEGSPYRLVNAGAPEAWIQAILPPAAEKARCEKSVFASATESEIRQGLFSDKVRTHAVIAAIRQPARELPVNAKGPYRKPEKQAELRKRVRELENSVEMIICDKDDPSFAEQIGERLRKAVSDRIRAVREAESRVSPLELEEEALEEELRRTAKSYLDMTADLEDFSWFAKTHRGETVLVTGEQGVGKTTFLKTWAYQNRDVAVFRNIKSSGGSVENTLGYLITQFYHRQILPRTVKRKKAFRYFAISALLSALALLVLFAWRPEIIIQIIPVIPFVSFVPSILFIIFALIIALIIWIILSLYSSKQENEQIVAEVMSIKQFETLLNHVVPTDEKRYVAVIIDSVEQLQDYEMQKDSLLRLRIPGWMTLVISCVGEEQWRDIPTFSIRPFQSVASAEERLWKLLSGGGRKLTAGQRQLVRSALPEQTTPLYLSILADVLRSQASYAPLPETLFGLPASTRDMAAFLLVRQEYSPAPALYWHTLGYLALSSDGLSETETLDLLGRDGRILQELSPKRKSDWDKGKYILEAHWARMRGLLESVLLEHEEHGLPLLRFRHDLERAAALNNAPPSGGDYLRTLARNLRNYFDGQDIYLRTGDGVTVNRRRVRELYPVLDFLGEYDKAAQMFSDPLCIDAYIRSGNYGRLRAELDALADRNAFSETLSEMFSLLGENDLLLRDCPDSFLSAYVRRRPDEASRLLPKVGQSVWLEVSYPETPMEEKHIYVPYLSDCAAALSDAGIIATLLGNRIRLFDWNTRMYAAEYRLEETENSPVFLYWEDETLIVRFARSRLRLLYADGQLHLYRAEACPELPLMDFGDREAIDEAGGLRECEERGYASEMIFPYRFGNEVRHAELFYPLGTRLSVYRHGQLAAVLVEDSRVDIVNLERNCLLRRLEVASAAYARFSPDGRRLLICRDDSAAFRFDLPAPEADGIPLPGPGMSLRKYSRKYNMALMREKLSSLSVLFAPTSDGELPVTVSRKAFLGDSQPLFACMSKEKDWLACYYYRRNAALARLYKLSKMEAWKECRVPPIFPQDMKAGDPFRALDDGSGLSLTSEGVTHIWRFLTPNQKEAWIHPKGRERVPRTERGQKHPERRLSLSYAFMWLLLPEAWRHHAEFLRGGRTQPAFSPIHLADRDYLWELDRNARRVSLLTKDGTPLCRVQLNRAILTAAVWNGELHVLPENGVGEIVIRIRRAIDQFECN